MFIRNLCSSNMLLDESAVSLSKVDVVMTDTGKTSRKEPGETGEVKPTA